MESLSDSRKNNFNLCQRSRVPEPPPVHARASSPPYRRRAQRRPRPRRHEQRHKHIHGRHCGHCRHDHHCSKDRDVAGAAGVCVIGLDMSRGAIFIPFDMRLVVWNEPLFQAVVP